MKMANIVIPILAICIVSMAVPQSAFAASTNADLYSIIKKLTLQVEMLSQQLRNSASVITAVRGVTSTTTLTLDPGYGEIKPYVGSSSVTVIKDMSYGVKSAEKFDMYRPARVSKTRQLGTVVMVHGGGWKRGDKEMEGVYLNKVNYFIPKGYAVVSINYPVENIDPKEEVNSVGKAISYLQKNSRALGIDSQKIVIMGHSAGAHLVSLLTADPDIRKRQGVQPWLATVSLDTAVLDVVSKMKSGVAPDIYGPAFGTSTAFWYEMSPFHQYEKAVEPILAVCSSTRADNPCSEAKLFNEKVSQKGGKASVLPVALSHGEVNKNLGLPSEYTTNVQKFLDTVGFY